MFTKVVPDFVNHEYVNEHHWPRYVQLKIHRLRTDPGT